MLTTLTLGSFAPFELGATCPIISIADAQVWYNSIRALRAIEAAGDTYTIQLESEHSFVNAHEALQFVGDIALCDSLDSLFLKQALEVFSSRIGDSTMLHMQRELQHIQETLLQVIWETDFPLELDNTIDTLGFLKFCKPHIHSSFTPGIQYNNGTNLSEITSAYAMLREIIEIAGALELQQTLVLLHICKYVNYDQMQTLLSRLHDLRIQIIDLELGCQDLGMSEHNEESFLRMTTDAEQNPDVKSYYIDADLVQF